MQLYNTDDHFNTHTQRDVPLTNRKFINFRNFRYHWIDTLLTVGLWIAGMVVQYLGQPFHRFFLERDPALSYPYVPRMSVPIWLLFIVCLVGPGVIIGISQFVVRRRFKHVSRTHRVAEFFLAQIVLFQALGLTMFLTCISKVFFGRQRPNFYAYCDYKGYRNAIATGDFTEYLSLTQAGAQGDVSFCRATSSNVQDAMYSHPSGHASLSFAGLGFLSLFLYHLILSHRPTRRNHLWKAIVFSVPMFVAIIVAATRTRDYWHNFDDTIMGAVLGFACASLAFHINYSSKTTHNVEYIGDLFPQNTEIDEKQMQVYDKSLRNNSLAPGEPSPTPSFLGNSEGYGGSIVV